MDSIVFLLVWSFVIIVVSLVPLAWKDMRIRQFMYVFLLSSLVVIADLLLFNRIWIGRCQVFIFVFVVCSVFVFRVSRTRTAHPREIAA